MSFSNSSLRAWFPLSRQSRRQRYLYWAARREWFMELDGERIARLSDVQFDDMFWVSCALMPLTNDVEKIKHALRFVEKPLPVFRHRATRLISDGAFPAAAYCDQGSLEEALRVGRVSMRGLYLLIAPLTICERVRLWFRNRRRKPTVLRCKLKMIEGC